MPRRYLVKAAPPKLWVADPPEGGDWVWVEDDAAFSLYTSGLTVFDPIYEPVDTGLLDKYGNPIVVQHYQNPIGFRAEIE